MNNPLRQLGNIPVTASVLESLFPHIRGGSQKLRLLERDKQIIRLKKGLYVCSPEITGKTLSTELIANHLYAPSYVSMSSALRYYGLIPEEVYTKQSMTLKYAKNFDTPFGRFEYTHISKAAFSVGLTSIKKFKGKFALSERCRNLSGRGYPDGTGRFYADGCPVVWGIYQGWQKGRFNSYFT